MTNHRKNRIVIYESSAIVREGLARLLGSLFPNVTIRAFSALTESEKAPTLTDTMVILNPETVRPLSTKLPAVLERFGDASLIGLITHSVDRESLRMFDDVVYLSDAPEMIALIVKKHLGKTESKVDHKKLSTRETDVLRLLVKGYSNKQIAQELFISVHTVVSHRKNISAKLGIRSIAGMTIYAVINNLIDFEDYLS